MCWNSLVTFIEPKYIVCYFDLYSVFHLTSFRKIPAGTSALILIWSNELINNSFQLMSLSLNLFFCIDLVMTLWSPFDVARSRTKFYMITSFIATSVLTMIIWKKQD